MSEISECWVTEKLEQLKKVTKNYSTQEKEQVRLSYLNNLLARLSELSIDEEDILVDQIESVISALPTEFEEFINSSYQSLFYNLEIGVKKRFNIIPKNFHRKDLNPFSIPKLVVLIVGGITIYFSAMILKNPLVAILIGIPLIVLINAVTGFVLDKKAQKENRAI